MQLDVEIGAITQRWSLGPDDDLDRWLLRCPWQSGEVSRARTLALASAQDFERIAREIRRMIYAADDAVYAPLVLVQPQSGGDSLAAIASACLFGEPRQLSGLHLRRLVLDRLARAPHIFLLVGEIDLTEQLRDFIEALNREGSFYPLLLLYFQPGARPAMYDYVLTPARFGSLVLRAHDLDLNSTWQRYLHSRASWESGGDLALAERLGSAWSSLQAFDEEGVEDSCQRVALERVRRVPEALRLCYGSVAQSRSSLVATSATDLKLLMQQGLLWQQPGHPAPIPAAWAVRGLRAPGLSLHAVERAALVNAPLASEILGWVFQFEAQERARNPEAGDGDYTEDSLEQHDAFLARRPRSAAALYPRAYPFQPSVAWFESFGSHCTRHLARPGGLRRSRLLSLRNGLCHGHFVGWSAIQKILEIGIESVF
jgi:hypothetical protein